MPDTPTITITQPTDAPPRLRITINNGTSVIVANAIWRSTSTENGGAAVCIANTVADDGIFDDFNVASGLTYNYYVVANDGSATATSATAANSITLKTATIHAVTKNSSTANATGTLDGSDNGYGIAGLAFYDQSHSRSYRVDADLRLLLDSDGPHIGLSTIEEGTITLPAIIPYADNAIRAVLREAYLSRAMLCLRTALGDKWFGRLGEYNEQQSGINFLLNMNFEILNFSEGVA